MGRLEDLVANVLVRYLGQTTYSETRAAVLANKDLFAATTESEWEQHRKQIRLFPFVKIEYEAVVDALARHKPQVLAAITSTPGGVDWLHRQVEIGREKLGLKNNRFKSSRFSSG